jgi:hypothetical protein
MGETEINHEDLLRPVDGGRRRAYVAARSPGVYAKILWLL